MGKLDWWTVLLVVFVIAAELAFTDKKKEVVRNAGHKQRWIKQKHFLRHIAPLKFKCWKTKQPRPEIPRSEIPKSETPRPEKPRPETPKPETPRPETPRPETPGPETPRPETPRPEKPRPETPRPETPRPVTPRPETPKPETPRPEIPRPETPGPETPRPETPRPETPRPETPRPEKPRPETPRPETPSTSTSTPASETTTKLQEPGRGPENRINCTEKSTAPKTGVAGVQFDYTVLYNFVPMNKKIGCWETVTYAISANFTLLNKLEPLLDRWQAPVSIALYVSAVDFQPTLESIVYLRRCVQNISELVTFHVYFKSRSAPREIPSTNDVLSMSYNCTQGPPWAKFEQTDMKYPVNVGRNVATAGASTHFHIVADIDFYPSSNLASKFIEMINRDYQSETLQRKIFVLPIFEVTEEKTVPFNKTELVKMWNNNEVKLFRDKTRRMYSETPGMEKWILTPPSEFLNVTLMTKRIGYHKFFEPVYIGTDKDPIYDESFSATTIYHEKRIHSYLLCCLKYNLLVLDNAFLVFIRRPDIKILDDPGFISYNMIAPIVDQLIQMYNITDDDRRECSF